MQRRYSIRDIARALNRSASTISDELRKNSVKDGYDPDKAQFKAYLKRHNASYRGKKIVDNQALRKFVDQALTEGQSPQAIAGRIKYQEKDLPDVSKNTVYRYAKSPYGKPLGLKFKKKYCITGRPKVTELKDRVFIDKRPEIIEKRARVGDSEGDFIVSGRTGKGVLLSVTDRRLRASFLELIPKVTVDNVHIAFMKVKRRYPEIKSLTLDNDILFQMHKTLGRLLGVEIYFCHPYHSWEKGSIENVNKQIRKFIPKGSDLSQYGSEEINAIEIFLNDRYMECLNYATPNEVLTKHRKRKKQKKQRC